MSNQSQLSTFNFESKSIRTLSINNEPWFVAKDLCDTLGITNPSKAILNLDDDEKMISTDSNLKLGSAGNGAQSLALVSESGMYTLILRCRDAVKKESVPHRFRKWVTAEVLPAIRKTGKYESKTTVDDRTGLRNAVNMLVSKKGLIYSDAYHLIHQRFNVESIEDLTFEQLPQAVEYVHRIVLEGELITETKLQISEKELPLALRKHKYARELTEEQWLRMASLWYALYNCLDFIELIYKPLAALNSPYASIAYTHATEYKTSLGVAKRILEPLLADFEVDPIDDAHFYLATKTLKEYQPKGLAKLVRI